MGKTGLRGTGRIEVSGTVLGVEVVVGGGGV